MRKNVATNWLIESGYQPHYQITIYKIWKWKISHYILIKIISFLEITLKKTNYNKKEYHVWKNSKQIMVLDVHGVVRFLYATPKKKKTEILNDIEKHQKEKKELVYVSKNAFNDFHQEIEDLRKKKRMLQRQN